MRESRRTPGLRALSAASVLALACLFSGPAASAQAACDRVATPAEPVQRVVDSLQPGQTACLGAGTYTGNVKVETPGITLTSVPGEKATVSGRFWVADGAHGVTVERLYLEHRSSNGIPSPTINADNVTFRHNDVTTHHTTICFSLGSMSDYGRADRALIERNRIHNCGVLPAKNHDHGIYVEAATDTRILGNWIYDNADRGIQLYPDAQRTVIRGNVIDGNGEGIIFSGDYGEASSNSTVEGNLVTNSKLRSNVESYWPDGNPVGSGNQVRSNCISGGARDDGNGGIGEVVGFALASNLKLDPGYVGRGQGDYRLAADSPCRAVYAEGDFVPGPDGDLRPVAHTAPLATAAITHRVLLRAPTTFRRGSRVRLRGRVLGAPPRPGSRVILQVKRHGRWQRATSARVRSGGRFATSRRLAPRRGVRTVRLRAVLRNAAKSKPVRLRVRGG